MRLCSLCPRLHHARGLCKLHYKKWRFENVPGAHEKYLRDMERRPSQQKEQRRAADRKRYVEVQARLRANPELWTRRQQQKQAAKRRFEATEKGRRGRLLTHLDLPSIAPESLLTTALLIRQLRQELRK